MSGKGEKKKLHTPQTNRTTTRCTVCYKPISTDKGVKAHRCNVKSTGDPGRNITAKQLEAEKSHNAKFNMSLSKVVELAMKNNNENPESILAQRRRAGIYR